MHITRRPDGQAIGIFMSIEEAKVFCSLVGNMSLNIEAKASAMKLLDAIQSSLLSLLENRLPERRIIH